MLEDSCYEEEEEVSCEVESVIQVENTSKSNSYILIIIATVLIIGGFILYKRMKKEVK